MSASPATDRPGLLERLERDVVLGAEGYLFELERRGWVRSGPYVPEAVLDAPDAVRMLHRELARAGAEVMVAFTYYGHRSKLRAIGREGDLEPLNRRALLLAREVAGEFGALVAGNLSNTWAWDPRAPERSRPVVLEMYREQVAWAAEAGVDLVISETQDHLGEALASVEAIREAGLPSVVTFASIREETFDGVPVWEACARAADAGADVVGFNCSRGPATMLPLLERVVAAVDVPVAAQPVPYRTTPEAPAFQLLRREDGSRAFPLALDGFACTRDEMAAFAAAARDLGARYLGVCCGGAPHHVRAMAEALGRRPPASRYGPALEEHPFLGRDRAPGFEGLEL